MRLLLPSLSLLSPPSLPLSSRLYALSSALFLPPSLSLAALCAPLPIRAFRPGLSCSSTGSRGGRVACSALDSTRATAFRGRRGRSTVGGTALFDRSCMRRGVRLGSLARVLMMRPVPLHWPLRPCMHCEVHARAGFCGVGHGGAGSGHYGCYSHGLTTYSRAAWSICSESLPLRTSPTYHFLYALSSITLHS